MADGREPRLFSTPSLYQLCVSMVVEKFFTYQPYLVDLPKSVRFDLYYQVKITSSYRRRLRRRRLPRRGGSGGDTNDLTARVMTVTFVFISRHP